MCGTRPDRLIASFFSRTVFNSRERLDARDIRGQRGKDTANSVPRCDVIGFTENNEPGLVCRCTPNVDGPKFRAPLSAASLASHVKCTSTQLQGLAVRHPLPAWCYRSTKRLFRRQDPSGNSIQSRLVNHSFRNSERISRSVPLGFA